MTVSQVENETDFEKLKELFSSVSTLDIVPIVVASINMFKNAGEFTEAIGHLQKKNQKMYDIITEITEHSPESLLVSFIDKIPEEKLRPFIELTLKLATIQNQLQDLKKLSAEKKIKLGGELKEIASQLIVALGDMEK